MSFCRTGYCIALKNLPDPSSTCEILSSEGYVAKDQ